MSFLRRPEQPDTPAPERESGATLLVAAAAWPGLEIVYARELDSTQDEARRRVFTRAPLPLAVIADQQTRGRGRRGTAWHGGAGDSLLVTLALAEPSGGEAPGWALRTALGCARALERDDRPAGDAAAVRVRIKWPNDLVAGGGKLGGILVERVAADDGAPATLLIGIGINVFQRTAEDFPPMPGGFAPVSMAMLGHAATAAAAGGTATDRAAFRARLFASLFEELHAALLHESPGAALGELRRRSTVLGRDVVIEREGMPPVRGRAQDFAPDGALLVCEESGCVQTILSGHLRFVPLDPPPDTR